MSDMKKIIAELTKKGYKDLTVAVKKTEADSRGNLALKNIKQLQEILPDKWTLNEATLYWRKLKGKDLTQRIKQCMRKPPKGIKDNKQFCTFLGKTMHGLGIDYEK